MSRPTKRRVDFAGLPINVEIEPGDTKSGVDAHGQPWEHTYLVPYGEIAGTDGADGDPVDVYLGPFLDAEVYIVHQVQQGGEGLFDEEKVFLGFPGLDEALDCYYHHGPAWGVGGITTLGFDEFRDDWLKRGARRGADPVMFGGAA